MLTLTAADQAWLDAYRNVLREQFPDLVQDMIIFGSKARGTARPDSDLDIVLIIRAGDWQVKREVTHPGYDLSIGTDVVPSFIVYTTAEWQQLRERQSVFREVVERDGVLVYETVSNPS
jgi:predicted nucleotidyltransferase